MDLYQILTVIFSLIIIFIFTWGISIRRNLIVKLNKIKLEKDDFKDSIDTLNFRLSKKQKLIDLIIDNIPDGLIILDRDLKIIKINESAANLFYLNHEKVSGSKTIMLFNNKRLEDLIEKAMNENKAQTSEITFYGDEDITLDTDVIPLDFEFFSFLILLRNTTQEVEFSKLRSQFVANVSHEMRTPLTSIKGYVETILENEMANKKMVKKYLKNAMDEVDRLNFIIEDVLNLSNIEYKRNVLLTQKYNIVDIIKDCINSMEFIAKRNNVKIIFNYTNDPINIYTDEELLRQLVRNLIENSIFHGGGDIELEVQLSETDSGISLIFSDNGVGIDKKDLPLIFQRFYRGKNIFSKRKIGSGLGLSIVKHIVELHGGKLDVSSVPDKKTSFTINIPRKIDESLSTGV